MKTVGIVCEYNPFHNGHKFHIEKAKEITQADRVVCVMSGSISQRGEVCIFDKWKRAEDAVKGGADLVIELPEYYVLQGADVFAHGAIKLLGSLGITDCICFGSECGDIDKLKKVAEVTVSEEYNKLVANYMSEGKSYPVSCSMALKDVGLTELSPNDMLGVSYLRAVNSLKMTMEPYCIKRKGAEHDSDESDGGYASASHIRKLILDGKKDKAEEFLPYSISDDDIIFDERHMDNIVRYVISNLSDEEFAQIKGIETGLHNRIKKAAQKAKSAKEMYEMASSSRYTISRIRRVVKCAMLNIDTCEDLSYIRPLSFNDKGRAMLKEIKESSKLEVISKLADFSDSENIMLEWDVNAADIASYCTLDQSRLKDDYRQSPIYIRTGM